MEEYYLQLHVEAMIILKKPVHTPAKIEKGKQLQK